MTSKGAILLVSVLALSGCQRKAPGPAECVAFARAAVATSARTELPLLRAKEAIDELTVRCLTTPFSRALLRCVQQGIPVRVCFARHGIRFQEAPSPAEMPLLVPSSVSGG